MIKSDDSAENTITDKKESLLRNSIQQSKRMGVSGATSSLQMTHNGDIMWKQKGIGNK